MTTLTPPSHRHGFTLVELSIVLIIIGLVVAGVFVGQTLILAAQVRAIVSQVEKYNVAVNTFRVKYDALPGDMKNAELIFTGDGTYWGNGNGRLEENDYNAAERIGFWANLRSANLTFDYTIGQGSGGMLVAGYNSPRCVLCSPSITTTYDQPQTTGGIIIRDFRWEGVYQSLSCSFAKGPGGEYPHLNQAPYWHFTSGHGNWAGFPPALSASNARAIDQKLDDGGPLTGNVVATRNFYISDACGAIPYGLWTPTYSGTYMSPNNTYLTPDEAPALDLLIKTQF